jgi:DNA-binding LacI/PurR family transcriptional regulator
LQDTGQAGAVLVDSLLGLIRGEAVESEVLPVKLMVRKSSLR